MPMFLAKTRAVLAAVGLSFIATTSFAGDQYIDRTGFAVSGYDVVAYFGLTQSVVGQPQASPIPGRADITADYNGSTFAFSSAQNRDTFLSDPQKYAPQYDGHCAYGVAVGSKVPANPELWRIIDDRLYLNITKDVEETWEQDISGYIMKSEVEWSSLEPKRASRKRIPKFSSAAPIR